MATKADLEATLIDLNNEYVAQVELTRRAEVERKKVSEELKK